MADLNLTELTSGAFMLNSGQVYVLEPGHPISIQSGDTVITISYNSPAGLTEVEVEGLNCHFEQTIYDEDEEEEEPDDDEPDSYSYCSPAPVTALDEHMNLHTF